MLQSLKSTVVPLFEKVLSASDAGRIGRLVLPKTCAEVILGFYLMPYFSSALFISNVIFSFPTNYFLPCKFNAPDKLAYDLQAFFPAISQSEGVPLDVLDENRNEWTFQFRFWPNNNSRMYVLEGVTPCIQGMQLVAGDTGIYQSIENIGALIALPVSSLC